MRGKHIRNGFNDESLELDFALKIRNQTTSTLAYSIRGIDFDRINDDITKGINAIETLRTEAKLAFDSGKITRNEFEKADKTATVAIKEIQSDFVSYKESFEKHKADEIARNRRPNCMGRTADTERCHN